MNTNSQPNPASQAFDIHERVDNYFVLVDFFKSYEEACDDAKKIIDDHPDIKKMFSVS